MVTTNEPGAAQLVKVLPAQAESWGYDSLWVTDHVVGVRAMDGVYSDYWLEALTALTWMAATTSRVRLGTGVLVVPHRNPVLAAKMITTIDVLSNGRVDLGVGTGWSKIEYRALGAENLFEARGRATDEALDVMKSCWGGGEVAHDGEFFSFRHVVLEPVPHQRPHPPLWIGGHSGPALRRAARIADVWHPHDLAPSELTTIGNKLDDLAERAVPRSVRLHVTEDDMPAITDLVDSYLDIGCVRVVLEFRSQPCDVVARLSERAAELLELDQPTTCEVIHS
ncbi:TIGR03619 family F420-dependent LLM class oxidoreductase [Rhodococcus sp. NPDC059968]|uniref:TIGR03619 family F420-dependent LLM class oxidoreductase n=1 Tax=Rhodococcus sp. NPDC059968 TaxID=3347017 RepID=UPI00366D6216